MSRYEPSVRGVEQPLLMGAPLHLQPAGNQICHTSTRPGKVLRGGGGWTAFIQKRRERRRHRRRGRNLIEAAPELCGRNIKRSALGGRLNGRLQQQVLRGNPSPPHRHDRSTVPAPPPFRH
eukprot:362234-Chlamydomonas_euryale.AAC.5